MSEKNNLTAVEYMEQLEARNAQWALLASLVGKQVSVLTDIDVGPDKPQIHIYGELKWREDSIEYYVESGCGVVTFTSFAVVHIYTFSHNSIQIFLRG